MWEKKLLGVLLNGDDLAFNRQQIGQEQFTQRNKVGATGQHATQTEAEWRPRRVN